VRTTYLNGKAEKAVEEIEQHVFRHLAVVGEEGSGKMSFVRMIAKDQEFMVVTLEETFDSKNLVGTYVCNEVGEFVFKKGPLTVAAENGMWLILKNIDKSPPDLLSFLLPLVQENKLQVTSAFSITPKLGFRMVALSSNINAFTDHGSISPFVSLLFTTTLDRLEDRSDFLDILSSKFEYVHALTWIQDYLLQSVNFITTKLNKLKGQLLDHKAFSVKQVFKLFARVNNTLKTIVDLENKDNTYISSDVSQSILLDIADTFLAHIYDKNVRSNLLLSLVSESFNPFCVAHDQVQLDPQEFRDFSMLHTRHYGISELSYFFGRSKPV
jgi:midasin (ATPase involved in ribosome maturation)